MGDIGIFTSPPSHNSKTVLSTVYVGGSVWRVRRAGWAARTGNIDHWLSPEQEAEVFIGGPAFRSSHSDHLLQMVDLIAHVLLKQQEEPSPRVKMLGIDVAFGLLDRALNRRASSGGEERVV